MMSIKTMLLALLGLNVFAIVFLGISQYNAHSPGARKAILQEVFEEDIFEQEAPRPSSKFFREVETLPEPELYADEVVETINPEFVSEDPAPKDVDSLPEDPDQLPEDFPVEVPIEERNSQYRFTDPATALALLEQLDVFEEIGPKEVQGANYSALAGGFIINNNYCNEHRAFIVENPEVVFEGKNVISNYWHWHKFRSQVIDMMGASDLHREIHMWNNPKEYKYEMKIDANIFFMFNLFFYKRQVGKQFSCLTQESNHIPGHEKMYRKDRVGQALVQYAKRYEDRPQCFNYDQWFPKTWVLQDKAQCLDFFAEFLSPMYQEMKAQRGVVYFRKIGAHVHEGMGVFPVNDEEEAYIQKLYKNGTLCGVIQHNNLIQYNVHNLLLVKNRKFGFRSFLLVASINPLIAYYHDGYARLSLNEYDPKSNERKTFVTNIGVNMKEASKGTEFEKLTPQEINDRTCWFMEDFQNHLLEIGRINDTNYLNNTLKPEFKKVMTHLLRMAQDGFFKKSSLFEIYGLDFVMDENLKLWFIEANTMPLVDGFTANSTIMLNRMLADTFEIVHGLLRSRMKRIVTYINLLTKEVTPGNFALENLDERREEFRQITLNHFEPEFEISSNNTYERIIYEKDEGTARYHGLITEECL